MENLLQGLATSQHLQPAGHQRGMLVGGLSSPFQAGRTMAVALALPFTFI